MTQREEWNGYHEVCPGEGIAAVVDQGFWQGRKWRREGRGRKRLARHRYRGRSWDGGQGISSTLQRA